MFSADSCAVMVAQVATPPPMATRPKMMLRMATSRAGPDALVMWVLLFLVAPLVRWPALAGATAEMIIDRSSTTQCSRKSPGVTQDFPSRPSRRRRPARMPLWTTRPLSRTAARTIQACDGRTRPGGPGSGWFRLRQAAPNLGGRPPDCPPAWPGTTPRPRGRRPRDGAEKTRTPRPRAGGPWQRTASDHLMILVTRPAPTVRPPSRMANFRPSSMAIGLFKCTVMSVLSPGITMSVPSGS